MSAERVPFSHGELARGNGPVAAARAHRIRFRAIMSFEGKRLVSLSLSLSVPHIVFQQVYTAAGDTPTIHNTHSILYIMHKQYDRFEKYQRHFWL